jgi:hypothetical protein
MDGSFHHWFEDRGPECCLMNMVDDATSVALSLLAEAETIEAAMTLLWKWITTFGIPAALYPDRKNLYVPAEKAALEAELEGEELLTHFGRACKKLGIEMIKAYSPPAKGRVERSNGTYQDRLVKELRLAGISEIEAANEFLYAGFLEQLNEKFAVAPREESDFHRSAPGYDLAAIFCREEERALSRDWIVRFENHYYQLKPQSQYQPAKGKVWVRKYLNGELHFNYRGAADSIREAGAQSLCAQRSRWFRSSQRRSINPRQIIRGARVGKINKYGSERKEELKVEIRSRLPPARKRRRLLVGKGDISK